jgi:type I restriction enzyme S subunit
MTNEKKQMVPELRFRGFTDDWEQRKFFGVIQKTIDFRGRTPRKMNAAWTTSGHLALSALNVKNGYIDYSSDPHYGDDALYHRWMDGNELCKDDVLFTMEAPAGNVALVPDDQEYILSQRTVAFRTNKQFMTQQFLAVLMSTPEFQASIKSLSTGGTAQGISQKSLRFLTIKYPSNLAEQDRISGLVINLNGAIALHQRKHEALLKLKEAYLQKLFPEKDNKYPVLRFAGFTDAWEKRKLSDLTESHNSGVYIPKDQYGEGTNIIGVGDIYDSDVVDGQRYRLAPVKDKRFILHTNDLLYGESSLVPEGIARVVSVSEAGAGTAFAWHTRRFKVNQVTLNSRFLGLELDYWLPARSHLMRSSTKTALTGITTQDFFNTQIVFPSKPEQEKIATLINSLDTAIALHQRKLEKLQELKKGYLQKMFC